MATVTCLEIGEKISSRNSFLWYKQILTPVFCLFDVGGSSSSRGGGGAGNMGREVKTKKVKKGRGGRDRDADDEDNKVDSSKLTSKSVPASVR